MAPAEPRFDILLPYYGDPDHLRLAVASVLAQSGDDWRLTVVDDSTEPGVPEWFAALGDSRVRYLRNRQNLGVSGNFNRCLELAEADHLVMMGCDDLMHPRYLDVVRRVLARHPGVAMVQPGVRVIDGAGRPGNGLADRVKRLLARRHGRRTELGGEALAVSLLLGNWLYFPALCWRTDAVRRFGFREDLRVIQDLALVLDLLLAGERLAVAPDVCFDYRRHAGSESAATARTGARFEEARRFHAESARRLEAAGWRRASRAARLRPATRLHAVSLLPSALHQGGFPAVRLMLRQALG